MGNGGTMKKKLLVVSLALLGLSDIIDARGGGGHGGGGGRGGRGGGGSRGHGGGSRGGHSGSHSRSSSRSSSHSHSRGHGGYGHGGYGHGGYGRGGYGRGWGGYGAWGGWGLGLGLGLGVGLGSSRWWYGPGYYGGTYIDNSNYENYYYDSGAIYENESGNKVADYKEEDRKAGLKKHIEKLKKERDIQTDQEKIDALEKRIEDLEQGL
jgi:hypothetical protein